MSLECWYYIAGIGSFAVALLGLLGLAYYAKDTHKLRKIADSQLESTIKPCALIMVDADKLMDPIDANLILKNVGAGAALNLRWRYRKVVDSGWIGAPALAKDDFIRPPVKPRDVLNGNGIECEFTDLNGVRYRTISQYSPDNPSLELRHTLEKIISKKKADKA